MNTLKQLAKPPIIEDPKTNPSAARDNIKGLVVAPRVLIANDDLERERQINSCLSEKGCAITETRTVTDVVACCERSVPELIIVHLEDGKGTEAAEVCAAVRALPTGKRVPILLASSTDNRDEIELAFAAGATNFVRKPVHMGFLAQQIDQLIKISRSSYYLQELALNDGLTGLPNRKQFLLHLRGLISNSRHRNQLIAVLFVDLDRFKTVNKTMGHEAGDMVLKSAAERIVHCVRRSDFVARLGDDEFTVLLNGLSSHKVAAKVASKLCRTLSSAYAIMGKTIFITASVGIAIFPDDDTEIETLMQFADTAMLRAKEDGGRYRFYESGMEQEVAKRINLSNDLRKALDREEMSVHYQPQMDLRTGRIVGMEALMRWEHAVKGQISPAEFITLAEENGMIHQLGRWILKTACKDTRAWIDAGYSPLRISVNLSSVQLDNPEFAEEMHAILSETDLNAQFLTLEITEGTIMRNVETTISVLGQLTSLGIGLALDDFGTGYSSLSYLSQFPIDILKIDRSFISKIGFHKRSADLVEAIVALAQNLHLRVVAEGVENEQQQRFLSRCECDELQGYILSRPLSKDDFEEAILKRVWPAKKLTFPYR